MSNIRHRVINEQRIVGRRLGRHVEHDARSRAFGIVLLQRPLKSVRWERHCSAYDQGDVGMCTGAATAGACMTGPLYVPGRDLTIADGLKCYEAATRLDRIAGHYPPDDTGSSGLAAARAAQKLGWIESYAHAFGLQQALHALACGAVITGTDWFAGFDEPKGDAAELQISGAVRGAHEYVIDILDVENGYVGGHNSWGSGWGNRGTFVMTFGTWEQLLKRSGDVTALRRGA